VNEELSLTGRRFLILGRETAPRQHDPSPANGVSLSGLNTSVIESSSWGVILMDDGKGEGSGCKAVDCGLWAVASIPMLAFCRL
jgi:hypothetical protein